MSCYRKRTTFIKRNHQKEEKRNGNNSRDNSEDKTIKESQYRHRKRLIVI